MTSLDHRRPARFAGRSVLRAVAIAGLFWSAAFAAGAPAPASPLRLAQAPEAAPLPAAPPRSEEAATTPAAPKAAPIPGGVTARQRTRWIPAPGKTPKPAVIERRDGPRALAASVAPQTSPLPLSRPDRAEAPPPRRPDMMTREGGMPLDSAALIGVMTLTSGRTALLRLGNGKVHRVMVGDMVEGWRVSAIGNNSLRLSRESQNRTFMLVGP